MRAIFLSVGFLALAATAFALPQSAAVFSDDAVNLPGVRDGLYEQLPGINWNAFNASSGFGSELADDIPADLEGRYVGAVVLYVAEWGSVPWRPFTSLTVNFYDQSCPPNQVATQSYSVPYDWLNATQVYAGDWNVYQCTAQLDSPYLLGSTTSMGAVVDQDWGENPPYCGLAVADVVYWGCESQWDGDYFGCPRWTPASYYFGEPVDLAYALDDGGVGDISVVCCFPDGHCSVMAWFYCYDLGGEIHNGESCDPNPCPPPTTSVPEEPQGVSHVSWGEVRALNR
ncbi:MAG: hypothetical protein QUU85_12655 [Candidatus Eisenbacteria bacterium]|nr:hypothetical protein [Candidatus Eisenbacteria bacterium]